MEKEITIHIASEVHLPYVDVILQTIADAAKVRGTGIAKRNPDYVKLKITERKAIIALAAMSSPAFATSNPGGTTSLWPTRVSLWPMPLGGGDWRATLSARLLSCRANAIRRQRFSDLPPDWRL